MRKFRMGKSMALKKIKRGEREREREERGCYTWRLFKIYMQNPHKINFQKP